MFRNVRVIQGTVLNLVWIVDCGVDVVYGVSVLRSTSFWRS